MSGGKGKRSHNNLPADATAAAERRVLDGVVADPFHAAQPASSNGAEPEYCPRCQYRVHRCACPGGPKDPRRKRAEPDGVFTFSARLERGGEVVWEQTVTSGTDGALVATAISQVANEAADALRGKVKVPIRADDPPEVYRP